MRPCATLENKEDPHIIWKNTQNLAFKEHHIKFELIEEIKFKMGLC